MRIAAILALLTLLSSTASAKPFYRDKWWWAGRGVSVIANAVDGYSTAVGLAACPGCGDGFPFFRIHDNKSIALAATIGFGWSTGMSIFEHKYISQSDSKTTRIIGYSISPASDALVHGWAAYHNFELAAHYKESK